ncbi:hypothetical protein [Candidatus Bathycorpusculum sp.]|uniref:hypothetical protein n=1 Tax=Candidatus Bathycorpusculum sp. TaxID=2994959 RepID=UPI00281F82FF|nr:hypothetical protein [Candidatus Termitimicrobium sp.]MCL2686156.1 hypothetical protein [Candidatus Termitimicrobium sp.]
MKFGYKIIFVAVLALLSGIAFTAPLLIFPIDIVSYPHVPQGPKADFSIELVYADFSLNSWTQDIPLSQFVVNYTDRSLYLENITQSTKYTDITYTVVANITNLSDLTAHMYETTFAAAQKISIEPTILGGVYFGSGDSRDSQTRFENAVPGVIYLDDYFGGVDPRGSQTSFGGVAPGVYLDGKWVNTTWIPGKDYPYNLFPIMDSQHALNSSVPKLPQNASEIGTWIEGVPIAEYYDPTYLAATHMYINGA